MDKVRELVNVTCLVEKILEEHAEARNSDDELYFLVCKYVMNTDLRSISSFHFLKNRKALGAPAYETVRRTRQKLQHDRPELASEVEIAGYRKALEDQYLEYVREF